MFIFLTEIGGNGYSKLRRKSEWALDEPLISEVCYLMQEGQDSVRPNKLSEHTLAAQRRHSGLPEKGSLRFNP